MNTSALPLVYAHTAQLDYKLYLFSMCVGDSLLVFVNQHQDLVCG